MSEWQLFVLNPNAEGWDRFPLPADSLSPCTKYSLQTSAHTGRSVEIQRKTIYNFLMKVLFIHQAKHLKNNIQPHNFIDWILISTKADQWESLRVYHCIVLKQFLKQWFSYTSNNPALDSVAAIQGMKFRLRQEKSPYLKVVV